MFLENNPVNLSQDLSASNIESKVHAVVVSLLTLKSEWPIDFVKKQENYNLETPAASVTSARFSKCNTVTRLTRAGIRTELYND